ncbi:hypothetical protein KY495_02335 [Massilia sp. PAMC28688]|uniref:DUF883 family protein n=1 Tax=Massilia sp. PAMC28688 TaxID=2861283 RepID=UPI001C62DEE6|nr:hypothetical protein [Massilia sp. PAMC28688]QYF94098.1 hypothetical protein KY495_02335 [Massilia sp. PAMC28688]
MDSHHDSSPDQDRLIGDLRAVIENAEGLLGNTSQYTGTPYEEARTRLTAALLKANCELERFEEARLARMMEATRAAIALHADQGGEACIMRAFK